MKWLAWSIVLICTVVLRAEPIEVAEWGTFTSLQDEQGDAVGGINTGDDERLPPFVRTVDGLPITQPSDFSKSLPILYPEATLRLETPVMYFYLPEKGTETTIDVTATFHGGWLTEFYPGGDAVAPGLGRTDGPLKRLSGQTSGTLTWSRLRVGAKGAFPKTDARIWTAPRNVPSAPVTAASGESEQYLFYRGVGHLDSPLRVERTTSGAGDHLILHGSAEIAKIWIVEIRDDRGTAVRAVPGIPPAGSTGPIPLFQPGDFGMENLAGLQRSMLEALVADGLTRDEAAAMLATWEDSYFKSPGQRVFFIVPQSWTEQTLPLAFSVPVKVRRSMVGRVELVTPEHRQLLDRIARDDRAKDAYAALGRFRQALLWQLYQDQPSEQLLAFVRACGIPVPAAPVQPGGESPRTALP